MPIQLKPHPLRAAASQTLGLVGKRQAYKRPAKPAVVSAACAKGRHLYCYKLTCPCPCNHGQGNGARK